MIIGLSGGLGNQIFQYALGKQLAEKYGEELSLDTFFYRQHPERKFELDFYQVPYKEKSDYLWYNKVRLYVQRIPIVSDAFGIIKERKEFAYDTRIERHAYKYYTGYWQNLSYIRSYREELQRLFHYPKTLSDKQMQLVHEMHQNQSVAVHVRHGDYTSEQFKKVYYTQKADYYRKAMELILKRMDDQKVKFYFFSDDIEWCRQVFAEYENCVFVDHMISEDHHSDFMLMRQCKHFITANSTFSWWGAWLKEQAGVVIVPAKWYYDDKKNQRVLQALIEPDWIVLDDN
jgi:hypothetical protein